MNTNTNANTNNCKINRPCLALYHGNGKGTGAAVKIKLYPATCEKDGYYEVAIAEQVTAAAYDWNNCVTFRWGFAEAVKVLQVLRGETESIDEARGCGCDGCVVNFAHILEPISGYVLTAKSDNGEERKFTFNNAEGLGLLEVLAPTLSLIVFGVPAVVNMGMTANDLMRVFAD